MKKITILSLALLGLLFVSCASTQASTEDYHYESIVDFPGMTAQEIYDNANLWAVQTFKKADSVIEYSNADTGTISGKFSWETNGFYGVYTVNSARAIFSIQIKDEKARLMFDFSEIYVKQGYNGFWRKANSSEFKKTNFQQTCQELVKDFNSYINTDSDW